MTGKGPLLRLNNAVEMPNGIIAIDALDTGVRGGPIPRR
jgi:hypothetical protein